MTATARPAAPDFDAVYRADDDPFDVGSSWYERRKIAVLLASLTRQRYRHVWDTACGTGHLTDDLAQRCDRLLASDVSPRAVELTAGRLAADRTAACAVVSEVNALPERPGDGRFDLIVLSEVIYYLAASDLLALPRMLDDAAEPDRAEIVVVNWRHLPHDAPRSGEQAVGLLDAALVGRGWVPAVRHEDTDFVLRSWVRAA